MSISKASRYQAWALVLISVALLLGAPDSWRFTPDSAIYIGTAESMVETGTYRFNGYPNLLYYPGTSSLLSIIIALFGTNFAVLHLFAAAIVVASLWLARAYFRADRYGMAGLAVPILLAFTEITLEQVFHILSDGPFLAISLAALLLWRNYVEKSNNLALLGCVLLVAFAPLVRFHGLFLWAAFGGALGWRAVISRERSLARFGLAVGAGLATFAPFALWTWRNVQLHTPDTYNMASQFFFGLAGLNLRAGNWHRVDWIDAEWKYGVYKTLFQWQELAQTLYGPAVVKWIPLEGVFLLLFGLLLLGALRWARSANLMELFYVGVSVLFLLYSTLTAQNLQVKDRLWFLMLPFLLVMWGFGLTVIYERLSNPWLRRPFQVLVVTLVVGSVAAGLVNFAKEISPATSAYHRAAQDAVAEIARFIDEQTPPDSVIATSDWGILPRALPRQSYGLYYDRTGRRTFERLQKYDIDYVVIVEGVGRSHAAFEWLENFQDAFELVGEIKPDEVGPVGRVYVIDPEKVKVTLQELEQE